MLKSGRKYRFNWKQREDLMEECIDSLDIWDKHGCRVICKGLEMLEEASHVEERCSCIIW